MSDFVAEVTNSPVRYAGFNLLLLAPSRTNSSGENPTAQATSPGKLHYDAEFLSNGGGGNPIISVPTCQPSCGCEGISNGVPIGSPDPFTGLQGNLDWPKVVQGREMLSAILAKHVNENALVEQLFELLR